MPACVSLPNIANIFLFTWVGRPAHLLVQVVSGSEHLSTGCTRQVQFLSAATAKVLTTYTLAEVIRHRSLKDEVQIPTTPFRIRFLGCDAMGIPVIRQQTLPVYPNDHAVQLVLVGSQTISTGGVRATLAISNFAAVRGMYSLQVSAPPTGGSATASSPSLVVDAGSSKQFQVTFTVSGSETATPKFTVEAVVGAAVVAKYKYTYIEDSRLARVRCTVWEGGRNYGHCSVTNLGPGAGNFVLTVSGGPPGFNATVSPYPIDNDLLTYYTIYGAQSALKPIYIDEFADRTIYVALVSAPSSAVDSVAVFQVTAKSGRLEAGSSDITFRVQVREIETMPF